MSKTISISLEEYEELVRYKHKMLEVKNKNKFNFAEVFALGSGKLNAQEIKNFLRKEW